MSGPTIFISAYRNFSIRYILYSDIFKVLKESGLEIVIFVKDKDVGYYQEKLGSENVTVVPILYDHVMNLLKSNRLSRFFVLIRKFMSGSTSEQVNVTDKARLYQYTKEIPTRPVTYLKFQIIRFLATVGNRWLAARRILVALESRIFNGRIYNKYFFKHNPQILIISSLGYMIDPYLMRAAKRFGCRIISIVHSWDNTSGKDYRGGEPNYVIAWNEIMKKEINIFHDFPEERIHVGGVAHWDFYFNNRIRPRQKEDFLKSYGLSENRKIIFYGLSNARWFPRSFDVIEIILKEITWI